MSPGESLGGPLMLKQWQASTHGPPQARCRPLPTTRSLMDSLSLQADPTASPGTTTSPTRHRDVTRRREASPGHPWNPLSTPRSPHVARAASANPLKALTFQTASNGLHRLSLRPPVPTLADHEGPGAAWECACLPAAGRESLGPPSGEFWGPMGDTGARRPRTPCITNLWPKI